MGRGVSNVCCNVTPLLRVVLFPLQSLGNSQREYEKHVLLYSIRNQLRFRNNLGETACSLYNSRARIHFAYRFTFNSSRIYEGALDCSKLCAEMNSIICVH